MRILVAEDEIEGFSAASIIQRSRPDDEVLVRSTIEEARESLLHTEYDIAFVDILFLDEADRLRRIRETRDTADSGVTIRSGLVLLREIRTRSLDTVPVVWTTGDGSRQLHLQFAHEELRVRNYCSKNPDRRRIEAAITTVANGKPYVDDGIGALLPTGASWSLRATIFADRRHFPVWRALALGFNTRDEIAEVIGCSRRRIGDSTGPMLDSLCNLAPGTPRTKAPTAQVARFAEQHAAFFLDSTVRDVFA